MRRETLRRKVSVASGATWTYDPVHKHEVTQAGGSSYSYSYDLNGNMTSRQGSSISWSSYDSPAAISAGSGSTAESVSFLYGPDRQRLQQIYSGNGTTEITRYLGGLTEVIASSNGAISNIRNYIVGNGSTVAIYTYTPNGGNTLNYVLTDHQASVAAITNSSGGVVVGESFTAFGARRNPSTWLGSASTSDLTTAAGITRQGYTSQTQLGLWMGLNHMNGRVEDSIVGRFLSADPHVSDPLDTQNYNRYSYVNNNPLSYVDPTGFCGVDGDEVDICGSSSSLPSGSLAVYGGSGSGNDGGGDPGSKWDNYTGPSGRPPEVPCSDPSCEQTVHGTISDGLSILWWPGLFSGAPYLMNYVMALKVGPQGNQNQNQAAPAPRNGLVINKAIDDCMNAQASALGFAIDQLGNLFGTQLNAQQAFENAAVSMEQGGAINAITGYVVASTARVGFSGYTASLLELNGAQLGGSLAGELGGAVGQIGGRGAAYAAAISGGFMAGYLATSYAKCVYQANNP